LSIPLKRTDSKILSKNGYGTIPSYNITLPFLAVLAGMERERSGLYLFTTSIKEDDLIPVVTTTVSIYFIH
jgi:hypothetical protein